MELKNYFPQNSAGDFLPGAMGYLYLPGTTTLASGLRDAAGNALGNPITASDKGLLQFAAPNGLYDLRVIAPGRDYVLRIQCNDVTESMLAAQTAAANAQAAAQVAELAAGLATITAIYDTYAKAYADVWTLAEGVLVRVLADETRGGRASWYRAVNPPGASLSLDFKAGAYAQAQSPLAFVAGVDLRLVAVPATATTLGALGDCAVSAEHFYLAVASNTWRRVALSTF
ncbi:hypothetical protein PS862_02863 [Pseudomonas fluorescens]|uniref:Uncharacterized protein n=1 Tax=Pseudomonas fluorescens TaxID=294 RepID=A0A5E7KN95_PSEFL|nr:hypothetical protein [Pseudomonas fluorescens]VVP01335.1 hypothetical protein PS862_02863 [Pseudomonas fluorescens]